MSSEEVKPSIEDVLVDDLEADESSDDDWQQVYDWVHLTHNRRGLVLFGGGPEGGLHLNSKNELFWWGRTWGKPAHIDKDPICDQRLAMKVTADGVFAKLIRDPETLYRRLKRHNAKMHRNAIYGLRYHEGLRLKRQSEIARIQYQTMAQVIFPGLLG